MNIFLSYQKKVSTICKIFFFFTSQIIINCYVNIIRSIYNKQIGIIIFNSIIVLYIALNINTLIK